MSGCIGSIWEFLHRKIIVKKDGGADKKLDPEGVKMHSKYANQQEETAIKEC